MAFKTPQLPKDAINTKEIDSIYKFLAHVSKLTIMLIYLTNNFSRSTGQSLSYKAWLSSISLASF